MGGERLIQQLYIGSPALTVLGSATYVVTDNRVLSSQGVVSACFSLKSSFSEGNNRFSLTITQFSIEFHRECV